MRDEIAREYDYDIGRIIRALQEKSEESGRHLVSFPPKRIDDDNSRKAGRGWRTGQGDRILDNPILSIPWHRFRAPFDADAACAVPTDIQLRQVRYAS